jgi:hypothetical protein
MNTVSVIQSYFKLGISEREAWTRIAEKEGRGFVSPNVVAKYFKKFREEGINMGNKTIKKKPVKRHASYTSDESDEEYIQPKKRGRKPKDRSSKLFIPEAPKAFVTPKYVKIKPPQKFRTVMPPRFIQATPIQGMNLFDVRDNFPFLAPLPKFVPPQTQQNVQQVGPNTPVPQYVFVVPPGQFNQTGVPQIMPLPNAQYGYPIPIAFPQMMPQFNVPEGSNPISPGPLTNQETVEQSEKSTPCSE